MENSNQIVQTLGEVLEFMAPSAGGTVPGSTEEEYTQWVSWIQQKQEEYARRAFWRRTLTRATITLDGDTTVLPARFFKPNGLYALEVDGVNYCDPDAKLVSVEMDNEPFEDDDVTPNANFAKWRMRFEETQDNVSATIWYFANPPKPTAETDKLILPGDMIGFAALAEHYRTIGQEGSQDKAEADAENRFQEYLALEVLPDPSELISFTRKNENRTERFRSYYNRSDRYINS